MTAAKVTSVVQSELNGKIVTDNKCSNESDEIYFALIICHAISCTLQMPPRSNYPASLSVLLFDPIVLMCVMDMFAFLQCYTAGAGVIRCTNVCSSLF